MELVCSGDECPDGVQVLTAREVPLGGPRAMTVRRTLPNRERSFVGAWCFVDHYGPDDVAQTGGMDVPPHPHTGLQTVSWLFTGEIEHRDSGGVHDMVRPGEVNLMTGARGICHSEVSTPATSILHGVQLWVVLPQADRDLPRDFQHFAAPEVEVAPGARVRVFMGSLAGQSSPVRTQTPLLGAEVRLASGTTWTVPVDPAHEHAVLVDYGDVTFCDEPVPQHALGIVGTGRGELTLRADTDARLLLLGGEPFDEQIVMWWNFIGRDHDDIATMRADWEAESERFGQVTGYEGKTARLPAPALPGSTLRPRGRLGR
ncbi:hypothetical protein KILIM_063_00140 [Kineosphaera limosa NBRC 100340]|uniref:Pirin family protein n=1 Tax=Kineosphaera limosa NBRC 100340 TaxID=1184609 RepID=K6WZ06_9MICO|nr:hypothetical protein KILIM_063_00140 [Kineosphaera limosa NBRC 100340]